MPTTTHRLADAAGLTYRQLDHWARQGWVHPRRVYRPYYGPDVGSGVPRIWADDETNVVLIMATLVHHGVGVPTAARAARTAHVTPLGDGARLFAAHLGDGLVIEGVVHTNNGGA